MFALVLALALLAPEAEARRRERNKDLEGWWESFAKQLRENQKAKEENKNSQAGKAEKSEPSFGGQGSSGGGEKTSYTTSQAESSQEQQQLTAQGAENAQSQYYAKVAKYYRVASSKTLAVGIVATAEGLGKLGGQGIKIGDGDTLVATGLQSLQAGSELKKTEEATLNQIKETASPKEVDQELMADPIAEEVITELAQKTGYSQAQVVEKILSTEGDLDRLAQEFEAAAARKEQISQVGQKSEEEVATIIESSKSGALRRKIDFASLRDSLAASVMAAGSSLPADEGRPPVDPAEARDAPGVAAESKPAATVASRAPASQPVFTNLGENLPSFELEQSQYEEAAGEASLFEKVHRKYVEIGPAMRRRK